MQKDHYLAYSLPNSPQHNDKVYYVYYLDHDSHWKIDKKRSKV